LGLFFVKYQKIAIAGAKFSLLTLHVSLLFRTFAAAIERLQHYTKKDRASISYIIYKKVLDF
jgi:hypothetical protein